jgi:hypothetical protein
MSEPCSLYLKVRLSKAAYESYLASPCVDARDFGDWMDWLAKAEMAGGPMTPDDVREIGQTSQPVPVTEVIHAWTSNEWAMGKSIYDESAEVWQFGILQFSENYHEYLVNLPFLRGVDRFKDKPGKDFLLVYPYIWDPHEFELLIAIDEGSSVIAGSRGERASIPAEFLSEAERFLNGLMPR